MTQLRWHAAFTILAVAAAGCTYVDPQAAPLANAQNVLSQPTGSGKVTPGSLAAPTTPAMPVAM